MDAQGFERVVEALRNGGISAEIDQPIDGQDFRYVSIRVNDRPQAVSRVLETLGAELMMYSRGDEIERDEAETGPLFEYHGAHPEAGKLAIVLEDLTADF